MSIRELPNFLRAGDKALGLPRRTVICPTNPEPLEGPAQPDVPPVGAVSGHDPASAGDQAVREWLAHVVAGRIGKR